MNRIAKRSDPQFMTRLPRDLHGLITEAAAKSGRSMNSEIIVRLEASFSAPSPTNIVALDSEIASLIGRYVDRKVTERLKAIAARIGEG